MSTKSKPALNSHELKSIETQLSDRRAQLRLATFERSEAQKKVTQLTNSISQLESTLARARKNGVTVSEHALLRYAERVIGYDVDTVQNFILARVEPAVMKLGPNGKFPIGERCIAVVRNNVVVTVETEEGT